MWTGRVDSEKKERFHQWVKTVPVEEIPSDGTDRIAFIGFASDEGVKRNQGRIGAKEGPQAIRHSLGSLPYYNQSINLYDVGDIHCDEGKLEEAQSSLAETVTALKRKDVLPLVLGGGHEVAWGHFQGLINHSPSKPIAIVNFDAHLDMRPYSGQGSSGTPFLQIANDLKERGLPLNYTCIGLQPAGNTPTLLETAKEHNVKAIVAEEIHLTGIESTFRQLENLVSQDVSLYVTVCLDVFSSAYAPGVSAPQPLGLTPWQVIPLLRFLANSGKVMGLDIAELSPPFDQDEATAKLASNLIFDFIHHIKK